MEHPWLSHYDRGVPATIAYPRIPLYRLLDDTAAVSPRQRALRYRGRSFSYGELRQATDRFAFALRGLGVAPGARVALLLPTSPPFVIAYHGILKAGAVVVPLRPGTSPDELMRQLADCGAEMLVTCPQFVGVAAELQQQGAVRRLVVARLADYELPPMQLLVGLRESRQLSAAKALSPLEFRALLASNPPPGFAPAPVVPDGLAVVLYHSDEADEVRGIMYSHAACVASAHQLRVWCQLQAEDVLTTALPLSDAFALSASVNAALLVGASTVLVPHFTARALRSTLVRERPSLVIGTAAMFEAISARGRIGQPGRRRLRGFVVSGASLAAEIRLGLEAQTGARSIETYGWPEAMGAVLANPLQVPRRPDTRGLPLPDLNVRVLSLENGHAVESGESGELVVRGPTLMLGYYGRPEATAAVLRGGWLHTGDIGMINEDGAVTITGRMQTQRSVGESDAVTR